MSSDSYHEPYDLLSSKTRDMHRAIVSLMEELEAVDWYQQRAEACEDQALRDILLHNKDEELEHAMMVLEWIRRHDDKVAEEARTYLFAEGPITAIEEATEVEGTDAPPPPSDRDGSLGIGSLK